MKTLNYLKYHIGDTTLSNHLDAVHARNPKADLFTEALVTGVIKKINASGIIVLVSREVMDVNRPRDEKNAPAIDEYRNAIKEIMLSKDLFNENMTLKRDYLHLAIHGMKDDRKTEFEIGTRYGEACSPFIQKWFLGRLKELTKNIGINNIFPGDQSKAYHRNGDPSSNYTGYGEKFNTIQIEINKDWRKNKQAVLIDFLSNTILDFQNLLQT